MHRLFGLHIATKYHFSGFERSWTGYLYGLAPLQPVTWIGTYDLVP